MKLQLVTCFLLFVSVVSGVPVTEDRASNKNAADNEYPSELSSDLYVYDDNGKLVKVDMHVSYPESAKDTEKDLPNRVLFYLYTRSTKNNPEQLHLNDVAALKKSHFDAKKETKIVTHGWVNSRNSKACVLVRDAFLQHGDYNILVVDWSSIAKRPYIWSSKRVLIIGKFVAQMIDFLQAQGMNPSQLTIVGHSLGGHVAGLSAHYAKGKVNYVVGLDPALPEFSSEGPGTRVSKGDANFVEIIHTSAGLLGYGSSIGDVDFYPNGGSKQNGCALDVGGSCSHSRSYEYYAESINSRAGFVAKKCASYNDFQNNKCGSNGVNLMGGIKANVNNKGNYYLNTKNKAPFALGKI